MDKQMDYGYGYMECQGRGVRLRLKAWLFLVVSTVVSMQLPCGLRSRWDVSEHEAWWVHWTVWWQALTRLSGLGAIGGNHGDFKILLFVLDLSHTMKNNCAATWRKAGWWRWKVFFLNALKQSLLTLCSTPRPVHTVLTNAGFQRQPPKEAESCEFKEEKSQQSEGQGRKNVKFQSFHPPS